MSGRRESVGRLSSRKQSSAAPPIQDFVSVAVLPPRLPQGMAPPTGLGPADAMNWDERLNWEHNEPLPSNPIHRERKQSFLRKAGLTTQRKGVREGPPFQFKQVPYETWRKHYAKDAQGMYKGTHAPAEDCLLKPADVEKWRLEAPKTKADLWTRGSEALPVYGEEDGTGVGGRAPEYEGELPPGYEGEDQRDPMAGMMREPVLGRTGSFHPGAAPAPYVDATEDETVRNGSTASAMTAITSRSSDTEQLRATTTNGSAVSQQQEPRGKLIANGKTAKEIIEAEREKNKNKPEGNMTWKERVKKGTEWAMMGAS